MNKITDFFKRLFAIRVIISGVEAIDDDFDKCHVCCMNCKCAMHHPEAWTCNCKSIFIDHDGKCTTFVPKDGVHGEFPLR